MGMAAESGASGEILEDKLWEAQAGVYELEG
jgi:hypothetical protein